MLGHLAAPGPQQPGGLGFCGWCLAVWAQDRLSKPFVPPVSPLVFFLRRKSFIFVSLFDREKKKKTINDITKPIFSPPSVCHEVGMFTFKEKKATVGSSYHGSAINEPKWDP